MGLAIAVGMLADLLEGEPEESVEFRKQLTHLNAILVGAGLPSHLEPEEIDSGNGFSCSMWGYSGLHYLRRIAAWDALGRGRPEPGEKSTADDPLIEEYTSRALKDAMVPYQHLMFHSDAEGFYVPNDFAKVIFTEDALIPGRMIGSTQRLLGECTRLAGILELPIELEPESDEVFEAVGSQGQDGTGWHRYGVESYSCLQLIRAAEASLRSKALIVFC